MVRIDTSFVQIKLNGIINRNLMPLVNDDVIKITMMTIMRKGNKHSYRSFLVQRWSDSMFLYDGDDCMTALLPMVNYCSI